MTLSILSWRLVLAIGFLGGWEAFGRLVDATWTSRPGLIIVRIAETLPTTLCYDIAVTFGEIAAGLAIGLPSGVLLGLALGRQPFLADLLRPVIVSANSIPAVALAPLLIMWFGLGLAPKIALAALVVFFIIFFNTFSGARSVDEDLIASLELMGATRRERFQKVVAPACLAWILSGLKTALPYSLIAATVGEMMLARSGVGHIITASATQYDITGIFTALFVLMGMGVVLSELSSRLERWLLQWRPSMN